jgi:tRNA threonylcarbamoyl adenosine modification protein (Sua5/YciO/YrdC/YwlC family)
VTREQPPAPILAAFGDPSVDPLTREAVDRAATALLAGSAVVLPTDTVYGVAALPTSAHAMAALFALKGRAVSQPLAVLTADAEQALALVAADAPIGRLRRVMERCWPGALTLVLPRSKDVADLELGGEPQNIGVRCPASPVARAIAARVGPIATTSANRSGEPTPAEAADAAASLLGQVALVLDGGTLGGSASTVVDTTGEPWRLLRDGPVPLRAVLEAAG